MIYGHPVIDSALINYVTTISMADMTAIQNFNSLLILKFFQLIMAPQLQFQS